jgi:hypothetical protein
MLSNSDRSKLADCPNRIHRGARLRLGGSVPSHFSYTPCSHELVQRGVRTLGPRGFGRARCIWRCVTRPTPPSRGPERHLFASTSSAINFRNAWRASQVDKGRLRSARSASAASSIWLTPPSPSRRRSRVCRDDPVRCPLSQQWCIDDSAGPLLFGPGIHGQYQLVNAERQLVVAKVSSQELPLDAARITATLWAVSATLRRG